MKETYDYPVYYTQGGGLVRTSHHWYIFVEAPEQFPALGIGDRMPEGWGVIPANDLAMIESRRLE